MKLSNSQSIPASRAVVWKALNDPAVLKACIPGCETITQTSPQDMTAKVSIKLGPVKASFTGAVKLTDLNPPESYRISGQGQGGLAGFASGGATVKLTEISSNETELHYDVDAQVGGKLAMLGSRLIDSTAKSLAEQFFTKFAKAVAGMSEQSELKTEASATRATKSSKPRTAAGKKKPAKKSAKKVVTKKPSSKKPAKKKPAKRK